MSYSCRISIQFVRIVNRGFGWFIPRVISPISIQNIFHGGPQLRIINSITTSSIVGVDVFLVHWSTRAPWSHEWLAWLWPHQVSQNFPRFMSSEAEWLKVFKEAWIISTSNGFEGKLKNLQWDCDWQRGEPSSWNFRWFRVVSYFIFFGVDIFYNYSLALKWINMR